jgi:hypothetical protein
VQIIYCDLCGQPLKESTDKYPGYYILYLSPSGSKDTFDSSSEYLNYLKRIEKDVKEICPHCKDIIDKIFELRLENLGKLAEDILETYSHPARIPPHEKKKK